MKRLLVPQHTYYTGLNLGHSRYGGGPGFNQVAHALGRTAFEQQTQFPNGHPSVRNQPVSALFPIDDGRGLALLVTARPAGVSTRLLHSPNGKFDEGSKAVVIQTPSTWHLGTKPLAKLTGSIETGKFHRKGSRPSRQRVQNGIGPQAVETIGALYHALRKQVVKFKSKS